MDGYSVDEAASVLGIPQGRVWELLARGVLVGTPEGETGMRVFLKPPPSPVGQAERTRAGSFDQGTNGNGGHGGETGEMSPFRELLTEFRNITERYGQALLALGEARGEVAALRSRVDLLEARIDLRLPLARPTSTVAWEIPDQRDESPIHEPVSEAEPDLEPESVAGTVVEAEPATAAAGPEPQPGPMAAAEPQPEAEPEPKAEASGAPEPSAASRRDRTAERRRRQRSGREAMKGILQALERAQDPTLAELPGAREAGEALAALRREMTAEAPGAVEEPAVAPAADGPEVPASAEFEPWTPEEPAAALPEMVEPPAAAEPEMVAVSAEPEPVTVEEVPAEHEPAATGEMEFPAEPILREEAASEPETPDAHWAEAVGLDVLAVEEDVPAEMPSTGARDALVGAAGQPAIDEPVTESATEPVLEEAAPAEPPPEPTPEAERPTEPERESTAPAGRYSTDVVEPDWFADGDFTWLDAADVQEATAAVTPAQETETPAPEASGHEEETPPSDDARRAFDEPPAEAGDRGGPVAEEIQEAFDEPQVAPEVTAMQAAPLEPVPQPEPEPRPEPEPEPMPPPPPPPVMTEPIGGFRAPEPVDPGAPALGSRTPRAGEEELMWLGDEFEAAGLEVAAPGWRGGVDLHAAAEEEPEAARPPVLELSEGELERLAQDQGWDIAEVRAIRTFLGHDDGGDLSTESGQAGDEPATTDDGSGEEVAGDDGDHQPGPPQRAEEPPVQAASAESLPDTPAATHESLRPMPAPPPSARDLDWLRGRRGPAATAYRRLRRLFPS